MSKGKVAVIAAVTFVSLAFVAWFAGSRREVVRNDFWDGSVRQVRLFLRDNWRDIRPTSINRGRVEKTPGDLFLVPCTIHADSRGAPVAIKAEFTFDSEGQFVRVRR